MIPVFSVVSSKSKMGKTTIICKVIEELKTRGYRVGIIKHHWGDFEIDYPGKDSWKHREAGADTVIVSSPSKFALIEKVEDKYDLDSIIGKIENVDIIITEGYRDENKPKMEVIRKELSEELICEESELFAVITDFQIASPIAQFNFSQVEEIVDLIENKFLKH